jgi:hypothetical protein
MKTFLIPLSLCLLLIISSCKNAPKNPSNDNTSRTEKLYIKTTTTTGTGKEAATKETITEVHSDYFEVGLDLQKTGEYSASKEIYVPKTGEKFKYIFFTISQEDGTMIKFNTSEEFLNFMSSRGYDMVNQIRNEYGANFTFRKKN